MTIPRYRKRSSKKYKKETPAESILQSAESAPVYGLTEFVSSQWVHLLLLVIGVAAAYGHTLNYPFIFDDSSSIRENPAIYDLGDIASIWQFSPMRFVSYLSFALNYHFHRYDVFGYHVVNILIHILSGTAVYFLLRGLLLSPAIENEEKKQYIFLLPFIGALIFLLHPLQTQAVTYIVQRSASLAALFYLSSMAFYVWARISKGARRGYLIAGAAASCLLAFFTKQNAITLPFALLLTEWVFFPVNRRRIAAFFGALSVLSMLVYTFLVLALDFHPFSLQAMDTLSRETDAISRHEYLATQMRVLWLYIRLFFAPINQHLDYDMYISEGISEGSVIVALLGHLFLLVLSYKAGRKHPLLLFCVGFYYLSHLVESSVIPIRDVVFEHRTYLPNFGLCALTAYGLLLCAERFRLNTKIVLSMLLVLATILGGATFTRNLAWSDSVSIWADNARKTPEKSRPHNNLGLAYAREGRLEEAVDQFKKAIGLTPNFAEAYINLGNTYVLQGNVQEAMNSFLSALEIDPSKSGAYNNIGLLYYELGAIDKAKVFIEQALALESDNLRARVNMGGILYMQQDFSGAEQHFHQALRLEPGNAEALHNLGLLSVIREDYEAAVDFFNEAILNKPDLVGAYRDLAVVLNRLGRKSEALVVLAKALEINPDYLEAQSYYRMIANDEAVPGMIDDGHDNLED